MDLLHTTLAFLAALGVLVVIHELGHYLVARYCGVKVLRFSFGFGKVLWSRKSGPDQTEWAFSAIPLGGYVKMLDEREGEVDPVERHRAFNTQSVRSRMAIVVAGPLANLLLAVLVYWVVFLLGVTDQSPTVGRVKPDTAVARAGFVEGDRVLQVDGESVQSISDLRAALIGGVLDERTVLLDVRTRGGERQTRTLKLGGVRIDDASPDFMKQIGFSMPILHVPPLLGDIVPGSPAERAGLRTGDLVLAVGNEPVPYFQDLVEAIGTRPGQKLSLHILRGEQTLELPVTPDPIAGTKPLRGRMGAGLKAPDEAWMEHAVTVRYGPVDALWHAVVQTRDAVGISLKGMWMIVQGKLSLRNVSGPLTIAEFAGKSAKAGIETYINFIAMISISIGVLNLLPIPILDGGHLLYYVAEVIRGKPLSEHLMELGQRAGLALLGSLMLLAFFNDITRQFPGSG